MKQAVVYVRSATVGQDGRNVTKQLKTVKDYAKKNNYKIIKEYVDTGASGGHLLRPAMTELRKDMERGKFDTVIAKDITRFSRRVFDYYTLRNLFDKHGVKIVYTDYNLDGSPESNLMESMYAVLNEYESKVRSDRIKERIQRSAKSKKTKLPGSKKLVFKRKTN